MLEDITVSEVVEKVAYWGLVPLALILLFLFGFRLALQPTDNSRQQRRNVMGLMLGLLLGTCAILLDTLGMIEELSFLQDERKWLYGAVGFASGFVMMLFIHYVLGSRTRSLFVAAVVAVSGSALYFYLTNKEYQTPLLIFLAAFLVGAFLYGAIFDEALDNIFQEGDED